MPASSIAAPSLVFCCEPDNDLYIALTHRGEGVRRYETPNEAVEGAPEGAGVLLLADGDPEKRTNVSAEALESAKRRKLRVYLEYPASVPGSDIGEARKAVWERVVVSSPDVDGLAELAILSAHQCTWLPIAGLNPWLSIARVAGYDKAVYGLPPNADCLLGTTAEGVLVASTCLSQFNTARFAPRDEWLKVWGEILRWLDPSVVHDISISSAARPAYSQSEELPPDAEKRAFESSVRWYLNSGLLVSAKDKPELKKLLMSGVEDSFMPVTSEGADGSLGILEGFASAIAPDGRQPRRLPLRADCNSESAMALAMSSSLKHDAERSKIAHNLLDYVYTTSGMCSGGRADPAHPAFGLIGWGAEHPAWTIANYGDDNARTILATLAASCSLGTDKWDRHIMRALLANLRTTGKLGFREDRVDMGPLEAQGWKAYAEASNVNPSPHFESYLWACNLIAYRHTRHRPFLDLTSNAIRMTMDAFPNGWRWNDTIERSRMILCLAWLVRFSNTPEHRGWLKQIAGELTSAQLESGAIPESLGGTGGGHYQIPASNEAYGTAETPLIQSNADPASDQLYSTGFALLGLREAAAALNDPEIKAAEDKLAEYLCRIQVRSDAHKWLDGGWFRAFDYKKWDYWASSADIGWGAWSLEAGWGQAWTSAVLAMRQKRTTLWDLTRTSKFGELFSSVQYEMAVNTGGPWQPAK